VFDGHELYFAAQSTVFKFRVPNGNL
jgi:hypothetical protein